MADRRELEEVARLTVHETLKNLGFDADNPAELQQDMAMIRRLRRLRDRSMIMFVCAIIGLMVSGIGALIWDAIKSGK